MQTRYLRHVPDAVVERLQRLADRDGTSVSAVAVRELAEVSGQAGNAELLDSLPDQSVDPAELVADLDAARQRR